MVRPTRCTGTFTRTCYFSRAADTLARLRREWRTASFGSALFWTPLCLVNFWLVPQHSRIVVVAIFSFLHKTWLSWLSNRAAV